MLNRYLASIYILKINYYSVYFNLKEESENYKNIILNDIDFINQIFIKLAFIIKKIGGYPILNLDEIINTSLIKQIINIDYTVKSAEDMLTENLKILYNINNFIGENALIYVDIKCIKIVLEVNNFLEKKLSKSLS